MEKGLTIRSGQSPTQKYWPEALERIVSGELDPSFLITHRTTLDNAPDVYKKFYNREEGMIKAILRPVASSECGI